MSPQNEHLGIVVGVDDSPAANVAVEWAARDAELRSIPLTLVHAVSPSLTTWWNKPLPPGLAQWQKDHGRRLLDGAVKIVEEACRHGGPTQSHTKVVSSAAVPTLIDLSKDAEMVVTGLCGTGNWSGQLLGSVSSGLLRHAQCPVAIIHDGDPVTPHQFAAGRARADPRQAFVSLSGNHFRIQQRAERQETVAKRLYFVNNSREAQMLGTGLWTQQSPPWLKQASHKARGTTSACCSVSLLRFSFGSRRCRSM